MNWYRLVHVLMSSYCIFLLPKATLLSLYEVEVTICAVASLLGCTSVNEEVNMPKLFCTSVCHGNLPPYILLLFCFFIFRDRTELVSL